MVLLHYASYKFELVLKNGCNNLIASCFQQVWTCFVKKWCNNFTGLHHLLSCSIHNSFTQKLKKWHKLCANSISIQKPTFDKGTLIDHIYVNQALIDLGVFTEQEAAYYTDHDIVTLFIAKQ